MALISAANRNFQKYLSVILFLICLIGFWDLVTSIGHLVNIFGRLCCDPPPDLMAHQEIYCMIAYCVFLYIDDVIHPQDACTNIDAQFEIWFSLQARGENLRWMPPRCLPDASQFPPYPRRVADASARFHFEKQKVKQS